LQVGLNPAGDAEDMMSRHVKTHIQKKNTGVFETARDKEHIQKNMGQGKYMFFENFCSERLKPKS